LGVGFPTVGLVVAGFRHYGLELVRMLKAGARARKVKVIFGKSRSTSDTASKRPIATGNRAGDAVQNHVLGVVV
jgi:hypothetical protein